MRAAVLAALCSSLALAAPDIGPVSRALMEHMSKGLAETKVGDWVTYRMDGGEGRVSYLRLSVVGEEKDSRGRDAFWIEMDLGQHHAMVAPLAQMRMLVAKEAGLSRDGITRLFMAEGADKPAEVDEASLAATAGVPRPSPSPPDPTLPPGARASDGRVRSGKESMLMTEAGTVPAIPVEVLYRSTVVKRFWMSRTIPLLHLAKMELPPIRHTIEVRGYGVDAKPRMILPDPNSPKIHLDPADRSDNRTAAP